MRHTIVIESSTVVANAKTLFLAALMCCSTQIDAATVCKVNGASEWFPIFENKQGRAKGIAVSVLEQFAATRPDVQFEFGQAQPWTRTEHQLSTGELDLIAGAYFNEKRAQDFHYSVAFHTERVNIFVTPQRTFEYITLQDLVGRVGIRPAGGSYGEIFDAYAAENLNLQEVFEPAAMLKMLIHERADYLILAEMNGTKHIEQYRVEGQVVMLPEPVVVNDVHFLFHKNGACSSLLAPLNQFILDQLRTTG